MKLVGTVQYVAIGTGAWSLVTDDGTTYELYGAPAELLQVRMRAEIEGVIREDVMSMAMIGPIVEVVAFQAIA